MKARWFARGDLDGFFGLFVDNLLQLMLVATLGSAVAGLPPELVFGRILPGAAVSILVGNLFYAWQARRLMAAEGRDDVTALPYGINTPSLIAFLFLIMGPVYHETKNATLAWQAGLLACLLSGLMEVGGAFVGDLLRRVTPRAAMLSALAGVAITFIAMGFVFQIFASPTIAIVPMLLLIVCYAGRVRLPFDLPAGLVAVALGLTIAWVLRWLDPAAVPMPATPDQLGFHPPVPVPGDLFALLGSPHAFRHLAVIVPMGMFNVIGSLQNLESAEAAGDRFRTRPSLLANGIGTLAAACFGSPFPTTIYIGHPGWKAMGARAGYSVLNGIVIAIFCATGAISLALRIVPVEVVIGILLWIGLIITAQAFQEVPKSHAPAVALGIVPSLAAWALVLVETTLRVAGSSMEAALPKFGSDLFVPGMITLSQGFLLTSMVLASILVFAVEGRLLAAAAWSAAGALLSATGLIHAYTIGPAGVQNRFGWLAAPGCAFGYLAVAALLALLHLTRPQTAAQSRDPLA
jgi:AGZA family xanthine/uracil permease-like MFS transporter